MHLSVPAAGRTPRRLTAPMPSSKQHFRWLFPALLACTLTGSAVAQDPSQQQPPYPDPYAQSSQNVAADPPSRVARLSQAQGNVSIQPASVQDFSPAEVNYPLTSGDRLWADTGSLAELQLGQIAVRVGQGTDFSVTNLTDTLAQFGLAQGSVHLRTFALDPDTTTELDTPNASVTVLAPGDIRIDVDPASNTAVFTLLSGAAQVDAQGFSQQLRPGESLRLSGDPVSARDIRRPRPDGLDGFSAGQDSAYQAAFASEQSYVSDETIGASDLASYGDWSSDADYGPVWYPRNVAFGWQPYRNGHWAYVGPWGWTWIESEPWGFAPFHYGRWGQFRGRWGWIPGPAPVRPIYSPALVVFVGGGGIRTTSGMTAWFPLGPREPFQPWYRTSDRYVTRVNVTNIYNRNTMEVRNLYAGRGPSPFRPDPNRQYVNRSLATVAIPHAAFASGRPVSGSALRFDPHAFDGAPVLQRPVVSPTRAIMAPEPAHALPPRLERPAWQAHGYGQPGQRPQQPDYRNGGQQGYQGGGGQQGYQGRGGQQGYQGGAQAGRQGGGQQPGYPNTNQPGAGNTQPGNAGGSQPTTGTRAPWNGSPRSPVAPTPQQPPRYIPPQPPRGAAPEQPAPVQTAPVLPVQRPPTSPGSPIQRPVTPNPPVQGQPPQGNPGNQGNPGFHGPVGPPRATQPETIAQPAPERPVVAPSTPPQRPWMNRNEPPSGRPGYDQPRPAMDRQDYGRQPVNNVPQNRPVPQPVQAQPQREAIPRPAPQPPPQPAPQPQAQPQPQPARTPPPPQGQLPNGRIPH